MISALVLSLLVASASCASGMSLPPSMPTSQQST
jgi:hypothetical protein